MCSSGLGPGMPARMTREEKRGGYTKGRRVVIWTFAARWFKTRSRGEAWQRVDIPAPGGAEKVVRNVVATGVVSEASSPAPKNPPYANYIMKLYMTNLVDAKGKPVGSGDGVVRVLALRARKVLPIANVSKGQRLKVRITTWSAVENLYGQIMTGTLPTVSLDTHKTHYWGQVLAE